MLTVPYEVKKALKQGRKKKEYKFKVYSGGELQFTIDNDNLVAESVKIDERMCSGDEIKFGLCEGSSLEFQYFGFDNIRGCEIEAILSVEYDKVHRRIRSVSFWKYTPFPKYCPARLT